MNAYIATSRDGLNFDLGWIEQGLPLIPPEDLYRRGIANGVIMPASTFVSHAGLHRLYFEARNSTHETRRGAPVSIGLAQWRRHRLAGLRRRPGAASPARRRRSTSRRARPTRW